MSVRLLKADGNHHYIFTESELLELLAEIIKSAYALGRLLERKPGLLPNVHRQLWETFTDRLYHPILHHAGADFTIACINSAHNPKTAAG